MAPTLTCSAAATASWLPPTRPVSCRVIQPQTAGPVHLAVVYLLAWVGAMLGTYLGGAYVGEAYTSWDSAGVDYPNSFYWKARTRSRAGEGALGLVWEGAEAGVAGAACSWVGR